MLPRLLPHTLLLLFLLRVLPANQMETRRAGDDGLNTLFSHTHDSASDPPLDLTTRWTRHSFYWTH